MTAKSKYPIILPTASTDRRAEYDSRGPLLVASEGILPGLLTTHILYIFELHLFTFSYGLVLELVAFSKSSACNVMYTQQQASSNWPIKLAILVSSRSRRKPRGPNVTTALSRNTDKKTSRLLFYPLHVEWSSICRLSPRVWTPRPDLSKDYSTP